jgi:hypothetical protein
MKEIQSEIEIQATPDQVWQILTDLDKYPEWHPYATAVGKVAVGEKVDLALKPASLKTKGMVLHCKVTKVVVNRELRWKYFVGAAMLFSGEHIFAIEPIDASHVRFIDREVFNGLLIPLQANDIDINTRSDFIAMDQALKTRAETL